MSDKRYFSTFRDSKRIRVFNCNESLVRFSNGNTNDVSSLTENDSENGILLRIDNLPPRLSDFCLKVCIHYRLKLLGLLKWIKVIGLDERRYSIVKFVRKEDAIKISKQFPLLELCGITAKVRIIPQSEDRPDTCSNPLIYDPNARSSGSTRTLYLGNLTQCPTLLSERNLKKYFEKFGPVINVDVKCLNTERPYCFIEFDHINSVVLAIQNVRENGLLGWKNVKANFGNSPVYNKIWVTADKCPISYEYAVRIFWPFSPHVIDTLVEPARNQAVVVFDDCESAFTALQKLKLNQNSQLMIDFCSPQLYDCILEPPPYLLLLTIEGWRKLEDKKNNNTDTDDDNDNKRLRCDSKLTTKEQTSSMNEHVEDNKKQTKSFETSRAKRKAEEHLDVGLRNLNDNENCSEEQLMKINNSNNKKHCCVENEENCTVSTVGNFEAQDTMCCALSPKDSFAAGYFRNVTYAMPSGGGNVNVVTRFIPPPSMHTAYYPQPASTFAIPDGNFVYLNNFSSTLGHSYWTVPQLQNFLNILPSFYTNGERLPEEAVTVTTTLSASTLQGIYECLVRKNRSYIVLLMRNLTFFVKRNVNFSTYEAVNSIAQSYLYYPIVWFAKTSIRDVSCEIAFRCIAGNFLVISQVMSALDERTARLPGYRMAAVIIEEMKPLKEASKVFFQGNDSAIAILRTDCFELELQNVMDDCFLRNFVNPMINQELVGFCATTEELFENQRKCVVHFIPPFEFVRQHLFEQHPTAYATLHLNIANYLVCVISTVDDNTGGSGNADQAED
ncbi:Msx2-interacting protein [Trichinella pseudospiralis]|uniref:Msx2-interacting protein n=1 Tax=Trichinella pseudospiralis TaxID=6337 RepID=A0A0V1G0I6_TRIPS|nr:Msx2-interacting protein [Trichinella pseudospiralis]